MPYSKQGAFDFPKQEKTLREILTETARIVEERRRSKDLIGLVRRPITPGSGGGDYLSEEVIGHLP